MVCPRCGKEAPDDTKFCLGCGLALFVVAQQAGGADKLKPPSKPYKPFPVRSFAIGLVAALVVAGVFWSFASSGNAVPAGDRAAKSEPAVTPPPAAPPPPRTEELDLREVEPVAPVTAQINATAVAFQKAEVAFKVLGMPASIEPGVRQDAHYPWGIAGFEGGEMRYLEFQLEPAAKGTKEALLRVGLEQTSLPGVGSENYVWDQATNQHLLCCGVEMDNVTIRRDLTKLTVHFYRRRK